MAETQRRAEGGAGYELPVYDFVRPPELDEQRVGRHRIVIVGGGLAGLTLACDLAARGVSAVLLDDDNTVGVRGLASRGPCIARKSLEIYDRLGIYDRIAAKGETWSVGRVFNGRDELYSFNLALDSDTKQPPFINEQQFYHEGFLVDRIRALGHVELRWQSKVVDVRQRADAVEIEVETPAGRYRIEAAWVAACDGANSVVRNRLGLDPPVENKPDRWCITDVRFKAERPVERHIWIEAPFNDNRAVWRHLMADDVWRLDFQMAPDSDPAHVSSAEVAHQRVRAMLGPETPFELVWVGPWSYRLFVLDRFRAGRVFFVGDAAHLMNPFGARGGNSGIQDADNLGWKLALVANGQAAEALLESYDTERRPAAHHNVKLTRRTGRFMCPETETERDFRAAVLDLAPRHPFARALVNGGRLSDPFVYAQSPLTSSGGHAAPNPPITLPDGRAGHLFDLARGGARFLGLWFASTADAHAAAAIRAVSDNRTPLETYVVGADHGGFTRIDDTGGKLARGFKAEPGDYVLLRPDQHVAAHLRSASAAAVRAAVDRALARG
jgi:3-(3-hydroxy-phenyl)propionate hydroxylase